jgi:hypothetical protein
VLPGIVIAGPAAAAKCRLAPGFASSRTCEESPLHSPVRALSPGEKVAIQVMVFTSVRTGFLVKNPEKSRKIQKKRVDADGLSRVKVFAFA